MAGRNEKKSAKKAERGTLEIVFFRGGKFERNFFFLKSNQRMGVM
jgi:hypothetical protein